MTGPQENRPRGPWDSLPVTPATAPATAANAEGQARGSADVALVKGQHPVWAIVSTLLLGGLLWYLTGSWIIVIAALWGLLVHEYGHVLAMNRLGMGPARIYVIPFLGGAARGQRLPASEWDGVKVSLAGPAVGLLAAGPFFVLYAVTGGGVWLLGAAVIAAINLVNLAPAPPLDGSRALGPVLARIHPLVEKGAMIAVGAVAVLWGLSNGSYIFAAFLALALYSHLRRGAWRPEGRVLSGREAGLSVLLYVATAVACCGVALAALIPLSEGSLSGALQVGADYLGFGR